MDLLVTVVYFYLWMWQRQ